MSETEEKLQQWVSGLIELGQSLSLSDEETTTLIKELPSAYLREVNKPKEAQISRLIEEKKRLIEDDPMRNREAIGALSREIKEVGKFLEE